jgi:hypothetical protein
MRAPSKGKKVEKEVWQVDSSSWEFLGKICSDQVLFGTRLELRKPNSNLNKPNYKKCGNHTSHSIVYQIGSF